jgi:hypothetical protein
MAGEAHTSGLLGQDRLLKHLLERHNLLKCLYNRCSSEVLDTKKKLHLLQFHDPFECAFVVSGTGLNSWFLEGGLKKHLRKCHALAYDPVLKMMDKACYYLDKTIYKGVVLYNLLRKLSLDQYKMYTSLERLLEDPKKALYINKLKWTLGERSMNTL